MSMKSSITQPYLRNKTMKQQWVEIHSFFNFPVFTRKKVKLIFSFHHFQAMYAYTGDPVINVWVFTYHTELAKCRIHCSILDHAQPPHLSLLAHKKSWNSEDT